MANELTKKEMSQSERFTTAVVKEFTKDNKGNFRITEYQRTLIGNYFIEIDKMLNAQEAERIRKNGTNSDPKFNNDLPYNWNNINLPKLATGVMHYARMGLDMSQPNMLFPVPYKNNKANKYDINLMIGYNGIKYTAEKYAMRQPSAVTIEVVYSTDVFKPIKKDSQHKVEGYEFEITSPFERGDIVGGFGYIQYADQSQNELIVMSLKDIEKRKPKYASANFWGGTVKEKNYSTGKWEEVEKEGWLDEMVRKTLIREVYGGKHMPVDPQKIDADYQHMRLAEAQLAKAEADNEINEYANMDIIDVGPSELPDKENNIGTPSEETEAYEVSPEPPKTAKRGRPKKTDESLTVDDFPPEAPFA